MMSVIVSDYMETLFSDQNSWKQLTAIVSDPCISNVIDPATVGDYMETSPNEHTIFTFLTHTDSEYTTARRLGVAKPSDNNCR